MLAQTYRKIVLLFALLVLFGALAVATACDDDPTGVTGGGDDAILATTTSTDDSGLLDVLIPEFEEQSGYKVKVIAVGSGQALEMGERGDADVLLAHAPSSEEQFVDAGYGVNRQLVMHNDFIVVGPADDSAGVTDASDALAALQAIAEADARFISRGDDSGTHKLELKLWEDLGVDPAGESWYEESGAGMGQTLQIANQTNAYTISDRATFLAQEDNLDLVIVSEGDAVLLNIYHVMQVNPERFDNLNSEGAEAFVEFMIADGTQDLIGGFGVEEFGQPLFIPDAGKSEDELAG